MFCPWYCNTVTMTRLQSRIRVACTGCRSVCDILSSRNVLFCCPSSYRSLFRFSYLVTKWSLFFVGWYGAYGVGLGSLLRALSSERLAISSALMQLRLYSATNYHPLIVRSGTVVREEEKSLNKQTFYTLVSRKLYGTGDLKLLSSFG